ncbi:ATP-binding protein [Sporolactobacillus shoreicorticis]|uniref:ATP/GTP-binding protein n=1 Tax=Sporolactobacillus shoreicorticis TaxID=1923877 RepID=A0ABW5S9B1_9BACL|nr:AAA family ATPase [Sporolactobacillus shoreicorticis]MCO7126968.1 ATP-binding protein [Sporolactobacillus shoreicorticis]
MNIKVRVSSVEIHDCKNVVRGKLYFPCSRNRSMKRADVLGLYGQNGSGKTAVVSAFEVLRALLGGNPLDPGIDRLIYQRSDTATFIFTFLICVGRQCYEAVYDVAMTKRDLDADDAVNLANDRVPDPVFLSHEEIRYKELTKGARYKTMVAFLREDGDEKLAPKTVAAKLRSRKENLVVAFKVNAQLAYQQCASVFFRKEGFDLLERILDQKSFDLLQVLKNVFARRLFVLNNHESGMSLANLSIPIHCENTALNPSKRGYGVIDLPIDAPKKVDMETFAMLRTMFTAISKVLKKIVPGLSVDAKNLGNELLHDGRSGARVELVATREGRSLPIACESDGIKKLLTVLSSLIVMYNDENACIVIDELDAGIYEFLLGEIVKILNDGGKGQLLFTSHNLRLLEVLERENLVFTSANPENRYIVLKGIRDSSNIRDVYIRAIQLGHDGEDVYQPTDRYDIMEAFDEAGELNHG